MASSTDLRYSSGNCHMLIVAFSLIQSSNGVSFDSPVSLKTTLATESLLAESLKLMSLKKKEKINILRGCNRRKLSHNRINIFYAEHHSSKVAECYFHYRDEFSLFVNFFNTHEIPANYSLASFNPRVFYGAIHGLLLIAHIYGLNYEGILNSSGTTSNIRQGTNYQRQPIRQFNCLDLILLASRAKQFGWYDTTLRLLKYASNTIKKNLDSIDLERFILSIKSVAEKGLSAQEGDELFDLRSRTFISISERFDLFTKICLRNITFTDFKISLQ